MEACLHSTSPVQNRSPSLFLTLSPCHLVTPSPCHPFTLSPRHLVTFSGTGCAVPRRSSTAWSAAQPVKVSRFPSGHCTSKLSTFSAEPRPKWRRGSLLQIKL